jgi:pyruvate formate lyase activating enzyme
MNLKRPWIRKALLYTKLSEGKVRCNICERSCIISPNKLGFCKTRRNLNGNLFTLQYGLSSGISANPMEKKPFYHFWPGSYALTIGSWSCNSECPWCQNYHISKFPPEPAKSEYIAPEKFVELMKEYRCQSTSISFNEPTLSLEWSLDVFRLVRKQGFCNTFVTNGYMTLEALRMLHDAGLDALCIDVKGDAQGVMKYCGLDVEVVWRNIREAKKLGMHVEVVNLVIPGVNDRTEQLRELTRRHLREAGRETPLHFTLYYPAYKFDAPPTPVPTLERARDIAVSEGAQYVYIGNVPGHRYENTYCPSCNRILIERYGLELVGSYLRNNRCPECGHKIPIIGKCLK